MSEGRATVILLAALGLVGCNIGPPRGGQMLRQCDNIMATVYAMPKGSLSLQWADGRTEPIAPQANLNEICTVAAQEPHHGKATQRPALYIASSEGQTTLGKKRNRKPYDPAEAMRREWESRQHPEKWGANTEALAQPVNADVSITEATRDKVTRIQRYDCFTLLNTRGALSDTSLAAVRRLQTDMAIRCRSEGSDRSDTGTSSAGSREGVTIRSLEAADAVNAALAGVGSTSRAALLLALCKPSVERGERVNWRSVVAGLGFARDIDQTKAVVDACDGLAESYSEIDNRPRRAA